jgi:hypothetical protein
MNWLTPLTALYAAAAAVPLLLLLYFLKLKRREQVVSSTLLWKRAVQDLQVNAPFQRIRRNILLLLQLLMLLLVLLALAGPILWMTGGPGRRYVLLIDRSASMNTKDVEDGTRLDYAKEQGKVFVESLRGEALLSLKKSADQVMVIAFDNHAKVMCNFTSDKHQLLAAIDAITPSDGDSTLAEAIVVARAFTQSPGQEANYRSAETPARLILFSDGRIRDADGIILGSDELTYNCTGTSGDNVAVTAMQARRTYENPDHVDVFATVTNYADAELACDVQLSLNEDVRAVRSVTVPPRRVITGPNDTEPGKVAVTFSLTFAEAGVLEVRHRHPDNLSADDAAWAILSPPKRLSVLLVTGGNMVLESALQACPLARFETVSPAEFDAMDHPTLAVEQPYDVIVLDNHAPAQLPRCRYVVFGRPPPDIGVTIAELLENQVVVDWRTRHGVLKYVNLANLFAAKCYKTDMPRDAEILAEFNETTAMALVRRQGSAFLLATFDVVQTNWPFEPSFILFCYNAVSFLGVQFGQDQQANLRVGEAIMVDGLEPDTTGSVSGPGLDAVEVKASPAGSIRLPTVDTVGIYSLEISDQPLRLFAVSLLNSKESDIKPVPEISLSGQPVKAQQHPVMRSNLPVWPVMVVLALIIAFFEWLVYNNKVRL